MKITKLFFACLLTLSLLVANFCYAAKKSNTEFVFDKFINYYKLGIDEKLYLQTDKPYYSAGEAIWFKAYVLNAITHAPLDFSNFVYVELLEDDGNLVSRVKVRREEGSFNGYINTLPSLEPGNYSLRAYTKWMTNKAEDFFFTKNIGIISPIIKQEKSEEQMTRREKKDEAEQLAKQAENAQKKLDYSLQFFAEGGALLANISQKLAFKALGEDGLSLPVKGAIFNSKDEEICKLESVHKGMGLVLFQAKAGEKYYAKVISSEGLEKRFSLPEVEQEGVALQISKINGSFLYNAATTNKKLLKGSYLVIHSRGQIIAIDEAINGEIHKISEASLLDGVSVFALVNAENKVISERIVFKKPSASPAISFESDASNYAKRSKVSYNINVKNSAGAPAIGEFAVSVVDSKSVEEKPEKDNILSYLLLSSEIAGHVEDPGSYFMSNDSKTNYKLDLLMLTQGWRRFELKNVLAGELKRPQTAYESGAKINGEVKGFFGNAARRPNIFVLCSQVKYMDMFQMDESSKFSLVDLNIPDSATYIVQAQGRGGGKSVSLLIEPEVFPQTKAGIFERSFQDIVPEAFVNHSQEKLFYEGGGYINIEEVSIVGNLKKDSDGSTFSPTSSTTRDELENTPGMLVSDILLTFPGVKIAYTEDAGQALFYRDHEMSMSIYLDDVECMYEDIQHLTADNIEQINVYDTVDAVMFLDSSGGVVQIISRASSDMPTVLKPNIVHVKQLGYQRAATFYQPTYDNPISKRDPNPDLRTTIYWNGALRSDENGNIAFDFYTADPVSEYTLYIEGMTREGEICRSQSKINRSKAD